MLLFSLSVSGLNPAQGRDVFDPSIPSTGVGLKAIRTYSGRLGGSCGVDGSTFWVKFPAGQANGLTLNAFTFESSHAERLFHVVLDKKVSPTLIGIVGVAFIVIFVLNYATRIHRRPPGSPDILSLIYLALLLGILNFLFLFLKYNHGTYSSQRVNLEGNDGNDANSQGGRTFCYDGNDANSRGGRTFCCCRFHDGICHVASHAQFVKLYGSCLCILYVSMDIVNTYLVTIEQDYPNFENDTQMLHFCAFLCAVVVSNMLIIEIFPVFMIMFLTRVILLVDSPSNQDLTARAVQLLICMGLVAGLWKREYEMRCNYKNGFLKFDLRNLELSAKLGDKVKKQQIERQAIREAKHMISECFHTVLIAAQKLENAIEVEKDVGGGNEKGGGKDEAKQNDTISVNCSKSLLQLCSAMISSAKEDYINLQKNYNDALACNKQPVVVTEKEIELEEKNETKVQHEHEQEQEQEQEEIKMETTMENKTKTVVDILNIDSAAVGSNDPVRAIDSLMTTEAPPLKHTVVIIDDNEFCREFVASQVRRILEEYSMPCEVIALGSSIQNTLDYMLSPEFVCSLVLVDMNMAGTPANVPRSQAGIYITQQYKLKRPQSTTKFVCVSGLGRSQALQEQCRNAGMVK